MALLKPWMLDRMRQIQNDNLVDKCTIHHFVSRAPNGYGGVVNTYSDELDVPCRLWISSGPNGTTTESRFYGDAEINLTDAFLILAWDQEITERDKITYDGREWEVVGFQSNDTWITAKRVRLASPRPKVT